MKDSPPGSLTEMGMNDTLVRYLLGSLPEEETLRLDELSIADDEFAVRLRAAEHDLIDAYIAGDLSAEDRARFEALYAKSPDGRDGFAFASALAARMVRPGDRTWWYRGAAAAAMVLLAIGGYWLLQPDRQESRTGAEPQTHVAAPAPTSPVAPPAQAAPEPAPSATVLSFVLAAPTRSAADAPAITVPDGTFAVDFSLELEGDDYAEYDATLKDAAGVRTLWRSSRVTPTGSSGNRTVRIRVPGNLLTARRHVLELRGVNGTAGPQVVGAYAFRVVVQ